MGKKRQEKIRKWKDGRFNPKPSLLLAFLSGLIGVFWGDNTFKNFSLYFLVTFVICFIGQIFFRDTQTFIALIVGGSATIAHNDICNTCHKVQIRALEKNCDCGGTFEPLENWKWISG